MDKYVFCRAVDIFSVITEGLLRGDPFQMDITPIRRMIICVLDLNKIEEYH